MEFPRPAIVSIVVQEERDSIERQMDLYTARLPEVEHFPVLSDNFSVQQPFPDATIMSKCQPCEKTPLSQQLQFQISDHDPDLLEADAKFRTLKRRLGEVEGKAIEDALKPYQWMIISLKAAAKEAWTAVSKLTESRHNEQFDLKSQLEKLPSLSQLKTARKEDEYQQDIEELPYNHTPEFQPRVVDRGLEYRSDSEEEYVTAGFDRRAPGGIPPSEHGRFLYKDRWRQAHELLLKLYLFQAQQALADSDFSRAVLHCDDAYSAAALLENKVLIAKCAYWKGLAEFNDQRYADALNSTTKAEPCRNRCDEGERLDRLFQIAKTAAWSASPVYSTWIPHNVTNTISDPYSPNYDNWPTDFSQAASWSDNVRSPGPSPSMCSTTSPEIVNNHDRIIFNEPPQLTHRGSRSGTDVGLGITISEDSSPEQGLEIGPSDSAARRVWESESCILRGQGVDIGRQNFLMSMGAKFNCEPTDGSESSAASAGSK